MCVCVCECVCMCVYVGVWVGVSPTVFLVSVLSSLPICVAAVPASSGSQQLAIDNPPQPPAPSYIFTHSVYSSARTEPCIQTHASEFQRLWKLHLTSPSLCAQYTALKTMTPMRTLSYTMRQRRTLE